MVIDRLLVKPGIEHRLEMSVGLAMKLAGGLVQVAVVGGEEQLYSEKLACPDCGINVPQLEPRSFSFNSLYGACPECHGLGSKYDFDPAKVITDWSKPLLDGGLGPGSASQNLDSSCCRLSAAAYGIDLSTPFEKLPEKTQDFLLNGEQGRGGQDGLSRHLRISETESGRVDVGRLSRLADGSHVGDGVSGMSREAAAAGESGGESEWHVDCRLHRACRCRGRWRWRRESSWQGARQRLPDALCTKSWSGCSFLNAVGLGYISLDRSAATLSGGEGQRIRLATQIGSKLRGVLYVLDEPSIGLHHRDNGRLLTALENLRDLGNTVLVVEHDEETIRRADYVVDLGPGAGRHGGSLVAHGTPEEIMRDPHSLTGAYISGRASIAMRPERRHANGAALTILGAKENNLQESRRNVSAGRDDGGDGRLGVGQIDAGE